MKVCIATRAPFVGGAEVAAERLALGLIEAKHEPVMLLGQAGDVLDRYRSAGLRCLVVPLHTTDLKRFWRFLISTYRLRSVFRRERFDLIHSNDLPTHQMVAKAARQAGLPRICHHRFPFDGRTIDWFNKYGAERHLFVSKALMQEICDQSKLLERSSRAVLYDGLSIPEVPTPEDRVHLRKRLGLPADRVIVLYAGQIIERKGVADLLHAWSTLSAKDADLHLIGDDLQGNGEYRRTMEELARSLGTHATFHGFRTDVPDWLKAADIAVVPSHVEPLGNATLEAMAHGLPVIGSTAGGIPEMIVAEQTGLLIPPHAPTQLATAMQTLIDDPDLRTRLGRQARQRCKQIFSLSVHIGAVLEEYRQLLAS